MAMKMISVTDIADFKLGNAENSEKGTGCTVIICEEGAVGGVDVRGGGPATRETDLLRSENTVNAVNAVVLSGGSAFGLEAASGVMRELADMKIGFDVGDDIVVPIVCGASLYDLPVGEKAFPDIYMGAQAVRNAFAGSFAKGNHGAGTGATVGKLKGYGRAMKTGLGTFACGDGIIEVGAIAAVNAVGDVYNGAGNIIAGLRSEDGKSIYGTIKTLKGMVHDKIDQPEEASVFINKSDLKEALAAAAKQLEEEEEETEAQVQETQPAEQEAVPESITAEPSSETVAGFVFKTPAEEEPEETFEESQEEIFEEPAGEAEEPEEVFEEPEPEMSEETQEESVPEEEFIPETPSVDIAEENSTEYAEISIPVVTAEPEETFEESVPEAPETEPEDEYIPEESTEDITEEPAPEEEPEETFEESQEEIFEEPAGEAEEQEEVFEEPEPEMSEETQEESVPEAPETEPEESAEDITEEPAPEEKEPEEIFEEPQEEMVEEPAGEAEEQEEVFEEPSPETPEEPQEVSAAEVPEFIEASEEEVEEPVALTREEMGYDIVFNTTISCLITNASLTKSQANKLASILHDAYARAIKPVHGTLDGDTVFVLATGKQEVNFDAFAALATDVMQYAIIDGAMSAQSAYGLPSARDMQ